MRKEEEGEEEEEGGGVLNTTTVVVGVSHAPRRGDARWDGSYLISYKILSYLFNIPSLDLILSYLISLPMTRSVDNHLLEERKKKKSSP